MWISGTYLFAITLAKKKIIINKNNNNLELFLSIIIPTTLTSDFIDVVGKEMGINFDFSPNFYFWFIKIYFITRIMVQKENLVEKENIINFDFSPNIYFWFIKIYFIRIMVHEWKHTQGFEKYPAI